MATEILTETIDPKGVLNILRDWYNNRAGWDDPKGDGQVRARREGDRSAEADRCAEQATSFIASKSTGGSAVSTPFSLRAELKGVEAAPGVTLRYWEAGAGRVLVMLPGLGHAASLYKYQLEGLCDEFWVIALDPRGHGESDKPERGYN